MDNIPKKLFTINDSFEQQSETYIIGTGRFALLQFTSLLQANVYVTAFISEDQGHTATKLMNKPVIDIERVADMDDANFIIATEEPASCLEKLQKYNIRNVWCDERMYSLIKDCTWSFM